MEFKAELDVASIAADVCRLTDLPEGSGGDIASRSGIENGVDRLIHTA